MATVGQPLVVWAVRDRKAGHWSMTRGLVAALATVRPVTHHELQPVRWVDIAGKTLQALWPLGTSRRMVAVLFRGGLPAAPSPELVIGSGGNVLWATAAVAHALRCPAVFIGSQRRLPARANVLFVHHDPALAAAGVLVLPVLPGSIDPARLPAAWQEIAAGAHLDSSAHYGACLVGGDGGGCRWRPADVRQLAMVLTRAAATSGWRWLVTTSRRTPVWMAEQLRELLPAAVVADACWVHRGDPRRVVAGYLGGARAAVVTADSMSMIHEAMAARRPVVAVAPARFTPLDTQQRYLEMAVRENWVRLVPLGEGGVAPAFANLAGYQGNVLAEAGAAVAARLGLT